MTLLIFKKKKKEKKQTNKTIFLTREIGLISRVLGNKDYLSNITISSLIAFLLRHRIARNCLIVAVGACGKFFGEIQPLYSYLEIAIDCNEDT